MTWTMAATAEATHMTTVSTNNAAISPGVMTTGNARLGGEL